MSLRSDMQQNIQGELNFSATPAGETREAGREEAESRLTTRAPERPAGTTRLIEEICDRENLKEALRRVKANKGSPGIDGITVNQLDDYLEQRWSAIRGQLLSGTYKPKPVKRVEIPKPDGGVRKLGIPTVLDRFIQQVVMQVLQRQWDPRYMVGWRGYFGFCETPQVLIYLTRWVRLRVRCALWRQWKTTRRRREALLQLRVRPQLAT